MTAPDEIPDAVGAAPTGPQSIIDHICTGGRPMTWPQRAEGAQSLLKLGEQTVRELLADDIANTISAVKDACGTLLAILPTVGLTVDLLAVACDERSRDCSAQPQVPLDAAAHHLHEIYGQARRLRDADDDSAPRFATAVLILGHVVDLANLLGLPAQLPPELIEAQQVDDEAERNKRKRRAEHLRVINALAVEIQWHSQRGSLDSHDCISHCAGIIDHAEAIAQE